MDNSTTSGATVGFLAGVYTSITEILKDPLLLSITWQDALDTAILAFIGGVVGAGAAELYKVIRKLFKKKDDKSG